MIVVDYNSTDGNYSEILARSKLKYTYFNPILDDEDGNNTVNGTVKFSKVKALNYGLNLVDDENSIAFIMDMHLQFPLNIFDRIRKVTHYFHLNLFVSVSKFLDLILNRNARQIRKFCSKSIDTPASVSTPG